MGRQNIVLTTAWQQIASGLAVFTVETEGAKGAILLNNTADDATAMKDSPKRGHQIEQRTDEPTFARATYDGWVLNVDGSL